MATKEELIGKAITDPEFRKRLLADPEGVIAEGGYEVDEALLTQLKNVDPAAADAATAGLDDAFSDRKAAS